MTLITINITFFGFSGVGTSVLSSMFVTELLFIYLFRLTIFWDFLYFLCTIYFYLFPVKMYSSGPFHRDSFIEI